MVNATPLNNMDYYSFMIILVIALLLPAVFILGYRVCEERAKGNKTLKQWNDSVKGGGVLRKQQLEYEESLVKESKDL